MVKKNKNMYFYFRKWIKSLNSLVKNSRDYNFPIKIELIISNNLNAKGLKIC